MVQQGRVAVNGRVMVELPILIDPAKDKVTVDDEPIKLARTARRDAARADLHHHEQAQGRCTRPTSPRASRRARSICCRRGFQQRVYPVGRLDADSQGLLMLTNDGELTNKLTHPRTACSKTYRARRRWLRAAAKRSTS